MSNVRITGLLKPVGLLGTEKSDDVYLVSPEVAEAAIAVIGHQRISIEPVSLTEKSKEHPWFDRSWLRWMKKENISAHHIPHHTHEGDEYKITDLEQKKSYQVKLTKEFYSISNIYCHYRHEDFKNIETIRKALDETEAKKALDETKAKKSLTS